MQINSINNYSYNKHKYINKKTFMAKDSVVSNSLPVKKDDKKNKKVIVISSVVGALLLAFIFRKNIKNLFKGNKPEPPKPPTEPPVEPPKLPNKPEKLEFDAQRTLEEYHNILN